MIMVSTVIPFGLQIQLCCIDDTCPVI